MHVRFLGLGLGLGLGLDLGSGCTIVLQIRTLC